MADLLRRGPGPPHGDARAGDVGDASVGHGCGAPAVEGAQAVAVFRAKVEAEFGDASGAVGINGVQHRLDLAAVEEVVRPNEEQAAVGEDLRLVVEDEGVGERLDFAPFGGHGEERAGGRGVVFVVAPDARGGEGDATVGQFDRIDVVGSAIGEADRRAAANGHLVDVEERAVRGDHREVDPRPVKGDGGGAERASSCVEQYDRHRPGSRGAQGHQLASDLHWCGQIVLGEGAAVARIEDGDAQTVRAGAAGADAAIEAAIVTDEQDGLGPGKSLGGCGCGVGAPRAGGCGLGRHGEATPRRRAEGSRIACGGPVLIVAFGQVPVFVLLGRTLPGRVAGKVDHLAVRQPHLQARDHARGSGRGVRGGDGEHVMAGLDPFGDIVTAGVVPVVGRARVPSDRLAVQVGFAEIVRGEGQFRRNNGRLLRDGEGRTEEYEAGRRVLGGRL